MQKLCGSNVSHESPTQPEQMDQVQELLRVYIYSYDLQREKWHSALFVQAGTFLTNVRWMPATVRVGVNNRPICPHNRPLVWVKFPLFILDVCLAQRWSPIFPSELQEKGMLFLCLHMLNYLCAVYEEVFISFIYSISFSNLNNNCMDYFGKFHSSFTYLPFSFC